jgi:hypothetical protein
VRPSAKKSEELRVAGFDHDEKLVVERAHDLVRLEHRVVVHRQPVEKNMPMIVPKAARRIVSS